MSTIAESLPKTYSVYQGIDDLNSYSDKVIKTFMTQFSNATLSSILKVLGLKYYTPTAVLSLLVPLSLLAESYEGMRKPSFGSSSPLSNNMSYHDVLKAWGPPTEKLELEGKRQDVWMYGSTKVIFDQGRVVLWMDEFSSNTTAKAGPQNQTQRSSPVLQDESSDAAVEEILRDILQEPTESESKSPSKIEIRGAAKRGR